MTLPDIAVCSTFQAACPQTGDHRPYLIGIDLTFHVFCSFRGCVGSTGNIQQRGRNNFQIFLIAKTKYYSSLNLLDEYKLDTLQESDTVMGYRDPQWGMKLDKFLFL